MTRYYMRIYDTLWHYMIRGYMTLYDKTIYDTGRNFLLPFFVSWMRIIYDMRIYDMYEVGYVTIYNSM